MRCHNTVINYNLTLKLHRQTSAANTVWMNPRATVCVQDLEAKETHAQLIL